MIKAEIAEATTHLDFLKITSFQWQQLRTDGSYLTQLIYTIKNGWARQFSSDLLVKGPRYFVKYLQAALAMNR